MCEPAHSIVQYPINFDDSGMPFGDQIDKETRLKTAVGKAMDWAKKIGDWFHFSKFGAGHSGALRNERQLSLYLPMRPNLFEGNWWDRKFHWDSFGPEHSGGGAFDTAEQYHKDCVLANMSVFRRFLETSMRNSAHTHGASCYVDALMQGVLTSEGANKLLEKFRRIWGPHATPGYVMSLRSPKQDTEKGIKIVMGFTRKRSLFRSHFADDNSLWVPGGRV